MIGLNEKMYMLIKTIFSSEYLLVLFIASMTIIYTPFQATAAPKYSDFIHTSKINITPKKQLDVKVKNKNQFSETSFSKLKKISNSKNYILASQDQINKSQENLETIKVALLCPLSGQLSSEGQAILNAGTLALFDLAPENFQLLPYDTGGTIDGAWNAAIQALDSGAELIIGPLLSQQVAKIAPLAKAAGINVIAFSNDSTVAGNGVYLIGNTVEQQVETVVEYVTSLGYKRFAALLPDNRYGHSVLMHYQNSLNIRGVELSRIGFYNTNKSDIENVVRDLADYGKRTKALSIEKKTLAKRNDEISRRALKRLEKFHTLGDVDFEALLLTDDSSRLTQIIPLIPYFEIDPSKVQLMGLEVWDDWDLLNDPTVVGGVYSASLPESQVKFSRHYQEIYGKKPLRVAALAYDAIALAAVLSKEKIEGRFDESRLTIERGFSGASGSFKFLINGFTQRQLAIIKVGHKGISTTGDTRGGRFFPDKKTN